MEQDELKKMLKSLTSEIALRNKSEYSPVIKASLSTVGPVYVELMLQNVGKTAAIDISLEFWVEPSEYRKRFHTPLLMPEQKVFFLLPEGNMKTLVQKYDYLKVKGKCKSIFGTVFGIDSVIDIKKVLNSWIESEITLQHTLDDRLRDLIDKIKRLERTLDRMKAWSGGVLIKTPKDLQDEREEWEKRREEIRTKKRAENVPSENQ